MSASNNKPVMKEDPSSTGQQNKLPAFVWHENGQCYGSIARRMRQFEREGSSNAYALWSEWVVPEADE